jgi:hypothetical protein
MFGFLWKKETEEEAKNVAKATKVLEHAMIDVGYYKENAPNNARRWASRKNLKPHYAKNHELLSAHLLIKLAQNLADSSSMGIREEYVLSGKDYEDAHEYIKKSEKVLAEAKGILKNINESALYYESGLKKFYDSMQKQIPEIMYMLEKRSDYIDQIKHIQEEKSRRLREI